MRIITKKKELSIAKALGAIHFLTLRGFAWKDEDEMVAAGKIFEELASIAFDIGGDRFAWFVKECADELDLRATKKETVE